MSKIKLTGNASGTGVLTVTAPNTNTDRTISLPDTTDTLAVNSDVTNKLPLAGGTMSGNLIVNASVNAAGSGTGGGFHFADGNAMIYRDTNDMVFKLQGAEKIRLPSSGGITFNGDTAAANALDDYEEGTHTVTATCSGGGSITLSSTNNKFTYTKIGNLVTITGRLDVTAISSPSGDLSFSLPFAVAQTGSSQNQSTAGAMFVWYPTSGDSGKWVAWADGGESAVYVRHGDGVQPPQSANLARVSTEFRLNFSYTTA